MKPNIVHHIPIVPRKIDIKSNFQRWMFWDVDMGQLSIKKDKAFIIDRVLSGSMENAKYLERLDKIYSKKDIINVAKSSNSIRGNESIKFIANRYGMNPKAFKQFIANI